MWKLSTLPELKSFELASNQRGFRMGPFLFANDGGLVSEKRVHENPLVPNAKLRQMFVAIAESRVLDEHIAGLQKSVKARRKLGSIRGQEACRVSTAIDLAPGDLVSDSQAGVVMELIAGAKVTSLLKRVSEIHSGKKTGRGNAPGTSGRILPWIDDAEERLRMAMGAALSFKTLGRANVVVAYVRGGGVAKGAWRRILELAARLELPIIFVILPAVKGEKRDGVGDLHGRTARWGVPGIPVDAGDAVALYRVAQESLGRTRGGDGPVLIECVEYQREGGKGPIDPVDQMKEFLLGRKVGTRAWLNGASKGLRRRIEAARL
jgi:TPP-dependent pyruvate/acetoin dehydrogenase alpha subunit